jgi:hypothetical protein
LRSFRAIRAGAARWNDYLWKRRELTDGISLVIGGSRRGIRRAGLLGDELYVEIPFSRSGRPF